MTSIRQELIDRLTAYEDHEEAMRLTGNATSNPALKSQAEMFGARESSREFQKMVTARGFQVTCYWGEMSEILNFHEGPQPRGG
jgi:hypothetical protein